MTLTHDQIILLVLLIILLVGTFKSGFKKTLICIVLGFAIDRLFGAPLQTALNINIPNLYTAFISLFGLDKINFSSILEYIKEFFSIW